MNTKLISVESDPIEINEPIRRIEDVAIVEAFESIRSLLVNKNYEVEEIYWEKENDISAVLAIEFYEICEKHVRIPLPENFEWRNNYHHYSQILYRSKYPADKKELIATADILTKWANDLPKLKEYHISISPLYEYDIYEVEEIFNDELEFDVVITEVVNEEDYIESDDEMYYIEAYKFMPEEEYITLCKKVDEIIETKECFCDADKIYRYN